MKSNLTKISDEEYFEVLPNKFKFNDNDDFFDAYSLNKFLFKEEINLKNDYYIKDPFFYLNQLDGIISCYPTISKKSSLSILSTEKDNDYLKDSEAPTTEYESHKILIDDNNKYKKADNLICSILDFMHIKSRKVSLEEIKTEIKPNFSSFRKSNGSKYNVDVDKVIKSTLVSNKIFIRDNEIDKWYYNEKKAIEYIYKLCNKNN